MAKAPTVGLQLKPSKWPFRIRSPIGEGARLALAGLSTLSVDRLLAPTAPVPATGGNLASTVGLTAEFGGAVGPGCNAKEETRSQQSRTDGKVAPPQKS